MDIITRRSVDVALELAGKGFSVFPLRVNSKLPAVKGWPKLATCDTGKIGTLWANRPAANVGIHTGAMFEGDPIAVVDVDVRDGKPGLESLAQLEREHGALPSTFTINSATGGRHIYFRVLVPVGCATGMLPGIDIKAAGGYVVGPGSVINGKAYEITNPAPIADAPDWLAEMLCRKSPPKERAAANDAAPSIRLDQEHHLNQATEYLERSAPLAVQGNGGERTTYTVACKLKDYAVSKETALELMLEYWNDRCSPPWVPDELKIKVANAYRYGTEMPGAATAQAQFSPIDEPDADARPSMPARRGLSFRLFKDVKPSFNQAGLIHGLLDQGAMSVVYGESNSGKTFIALDLCFSVATGRDWGGRRVEQGAVLYIAAEGGRGVERRVQALKVHYQMEEEDVPLALVTSSVNLLDPKADTAEIITLAKELETQTGQPLAMIVIDTMARALAGGDENSGKDMGAVVMNLDRVRAKTGAHVLVVHHSGKDTSRGARGHSSLRAATDTEIEIANNTATVTKQRDMEAGRPVGFRLHPVEIGTDEDGNAVTSCVLTLVDQSAVRDFAKKPPTGAAAVTLNALQRLIETEGQDAPGEHPAFTDGAKAVPIERWRQAYFAGQIGLSDGDKPDTVRKRFNRSLDGLRTLGHIQVSNGFVWVLK